MEETIEISKETYNHLCKLARFVSNYCNGYRICKKCGTYVANGYCCIECGHDPSCDY